MTDIKKLSISDLVSNLQQSDLEWNPEKYLKIRILLKKNIEQLSQSVNFNQNKGSSSFDLSMNKIPFFGSKFDVQTGFKAQEAILPEIQQQTKPQDNFDNIFERIQGNKIISYCYSKIQDSGIHLQNTMAMALGEAEGQDFGSSFVDPGDQNQNDPSIIPQQMHKKSRMDPFKIIRMGNDVGKSQNLLMNNKNDIPSDGNFVFCIVFF